MRADTGARDCSTIYRQIDTYQSIYGNPLVAQWHRSDRVSLSGSAITAWQDSIGLLTLPAAGVPNRPTSIVNAYWGGKPIPSFSRAGVSALNNVGAPKTLFLAGSRPWVGTAVRFPVVSSVDQYAYWIYNTGVNQECAALRHRPDNGVCGTISGGTLTTPEWVIDSLPHWHEVWIDSGGVRRHAVDGVVIGSAGTGITEGFEGASFSLSSSSATFACDCEIGLHLIASSVPSNAARARGMAFAKADLSF